jgi:hypothetical protein
MNSTSEPGHGCPKKFSSIAGETGAGYAGYETQSRTVRSPTTHYATSAAPNPPSRHLGQVFPTRRRTGKRLRIPEWAALGQRTGRPSVAAMVWV